MWPREKLLAIAGSKVVLVASASLTSGTAGLFVGLRVASKRLERKYAEISRQEIEEAKKFYRAMHVQPYPSPKDAAEALGADVKLAEAAAALLTYQEGMPSPLADAEKPAEEVDEELDDEESFNIFTSAGDIRDLDLEEEQDKRLPDQPYVISHEEFLANEPDFIQDSLTFFEGDEVLMDCRDKVLDVEATIGSESLQRFGHGSNDPRIVYVRNEAMQMDWEVLHSDGSYAQNILGFIEHSEKSRLKKFRLRDEE